MAWIRWRKNARGIAMATIQWRNSAGKVMSDALGSSDPVFAEAKRRHIEATLEGRRSTLSTDDPHEALNHFLTDKAVSISSTASLDPYESKMKPLFRYLAREPMTTWRRADLIAYLSEKNWKPATSRKLVGFCRQFIKWARLNHLPVPDFAADIKLPGVEVEDVVILTPKQIAGVLTEAARSAPNMTDSPADGHVLELPIGFSMFCGFDPADFRAIQRKHLDFKGHTITWRRRKTGRPYDLSIPPTLLAMLKRHGVHRRGATSLVCQGLPKDSSGLNRMLHLLLDRAGIPKPPRGQGGFRLFRHTYATLQIRAGVDPATVSRALGHEKGSAQVWRYLETDLAQIRKAQAAVGDAIANALEEKS